MAELQEWWNNLPPVTKVLFGGSMVFTLGGNFGLVSPGLLMFMPNEIYSRFEIWRLATTFFFHGKLGIGFLMTMMWIIRYGASLERGVFADDTADMLWFILVVCGLSYIPGYFLPLPMLAKVLVMALIYYWSRKNPDQQMSFLFGIKFKAFYFPWVLIAFRVLLGKNPVTEVIGVLIGHIFLFFREYYPLQGGPDLLATPAVLKGMFPGPVIGHAPAGMQAGRQPGLNWGAGHRLG
eukprot:TRINITY_DN7199_c0_g1_i1.p1 TRINITY_DN7199_c0_g1~~TRINITY_DN7199_c0_g1_i1.p1  ORF type:complete len:246 (+),score=48.95 TRINITY_DN7199_c0_g1_i1:33-740(+)